MPIYEYQCEKCDEKIEVLQGINDPPLATHEGCGGKLKRLISSPAFQFKGTGWYVTDYARKSSGPPPSKSESNGSSSGSGAGSAGGGDSSPAKSEKKDS